MNGLLLTIAGWGLGGFVNGSLGFGAALVAMPIVALGNDLPLALPTCSLLILALNVQMTWRYRRHLLGGPIWLMLGGAVPGAVTGWWLLRSVSATGLKLGLGLLLLGCAGWGFFTERLQRGPVAAPWGLLAGFLSTCFGTAFGINGPPPAAYMALRGGSQAATKGTLGCFFIWSTVCMLAAQAEAGMFSLRAMALAGAALPCLLVFGSLGLRVSARLGTRTFHRGMLSLLLIMGLHLIWTSLSSPPKQGAILCNAPWLPAPVAVSVWKWQNDCRPEVSRSSPWPDPSTGSTPRWPAG